MFWFNNKFWKFHFQRMVASCYRFLMTLTYSDLLKSFFSLRNRIIFVRFLKNMLPSTHLNANKSYNLWRKKNNFEILMDFWVIYFFAIFNVSLRVWCDEYSIWFWTKIFTRSNQMKVIHISCWVSSDGIS